jgi:UDP-N-acetylglucosamine 3-dehydrogenase
MRVGIVGAGAMAVVHAGAYGTMDDVDVAAVYGRTEGGAKAVAENVGAVFTTDFDSLLADPTIEAVDVCVPSPVHREFVVAALNAGKHVFCETPLALTLDDAIVMRDAARDSGRLLLVGLLMRSVSEYQYVQQAVSSGRVGRLLAVYAYRLGSYLRPESEEYKEHYGDPTTELMTFDFDVVNWLLGLPRQVYATASRTRDGQPGHVLAALSYDDLVVNVEASGVMPAGFPFSVGLRVVGELEVLEIMTKFGDGMPATNFTSYSSDGRAVPVRVEGHNPYEAECQYFINSIRGTADPSFLDAERAIDALQVSLATRQAIDERGSVAVTG